MCLTPTSKQYLHQLLIFAHNYNYTIMQRINTYEKVKGLTLIPDFVSKELEKKLIEDINERQWNTSLKRRTQHYGYQYSYQVKNTLVETQPIPQNFLPVKHKIETLLHERISQKVKQKFSFNQLIVNQYQPGQGIAAHIDSPALFSDVIAGLSLGSNTTMIFQKQGQKQEIRLQRRSLMLMEGQCRWLWKHSIPSRKKDNGILRGTRISMTWRSVVHH